MKSLKLIGLALGASLALSTAALAQDITIAVAGPITGSESAFGRQMKNGAEQAVADLNAGGGVLGKKLALEIGDDACDPKQARSVAENLQMGADATECSEADRSAELERVFTLFPRLKERMTQRGGTLSGGEQQMLAIGRALMSRPRLLMLDEPSLGLAPLIARQIFDAIRTLNRQDGLTVLIVEQNANHALRLAHRGYVMVNGLITLEGTGAELLQRPEIRAAYLEGGRRA